MLTRKQVEEARKLEQAATKGPWSYFCQAKVIEVQSGEKPKAVIAWPGFDSSDFPLREQRDTAVFIAVSRTIVPAALDTIDALMPLVKELGKMYCTSWDGDPDERFKALCGGICPSCLARKAEKEWEG